MKGFKILVTVSLISLLVSSGFTQELGIQERVIQDGSTQESDQLPKDKISQFVSVLGGLHEKTYDGAGEGINALEQAFYMENPWRFIQKKLIEEPNGKALHFGVLTGDTLVIGGTALCILCTGYPKLSLAAGALVLVLVNALLKTQFKKNAYKTFFEKYCTDKDFYRQNTPSQLQPLFDAVARLSYEEFKEFIASDLGQSICDAVKEYNPSFKFEDKFNKKLKYTAIGSAFIWLVLWMCVELVLIEKLHGDVALLTREVSEESDTNAGILRLNQYMAEQIRQDSAHPIDIRAGYNPSRAVLDLVGQAESSNLTRRLNDVWLGRLHGR